MIGCFSYNKIFTVTFTNQTFTIFVYSKIGVDPTKNKQINKKNHYEN